jgi:dihydropteroate synthase
MNSDAQHIHFVTGRLAEQAVRTMVAQTAEQYHFEYSLSVLPITVAALITPKWLVRHLQIPSSAQRVILPGHLQHDLPQLQQILGQHVECGPRDIRDLPTFFGGKRQRDPNYGQHSIEIIAEINHAGQLSLAELVETARELLRDGADIIDLGCTPANRWTQVADAVARLADENIRVSIDSFDPWEVSQACAAGAELVLSVNSSNRQAALDWGRTVVVIPDQPGDKKSFDETINFLLKHDVSIRLDPILEPLACGFTDSLVRYVDCRRDYPDAQIMMGIGNISELTDVDSAGINTLLLGICQELKIQSVLTTQVINWARTSVRECDLARRLMHFAVQHRIPPKHLEPQLVILRDPEIKTHSQELLASMAASIRDNNIRLYVTDGKIQALSAGVHVADKDPFKTMELLLASSVGESINVEHAFYLGFEMAKAMTANHLGKHYEQDQPLNWGHLTHSEPRHRLKRRSRGQARPTRPQKQQSAPAEPSEPAEPTVPWNLPRQP